MKHSKNPRFTMNMLCAGVLLVSAVGKYPNCSVWEYSSKDFGGREFNMPTVGQYSNSKIRNQKHTIISLTSTLEICALR